MPANGKEPSARLSNLSASRAMKIQRKRPLVVSSTNNAPQATATTRMLEQLLDGSKKPKKKFKQKEPRPAKKLSLNQPSRFSHLSMKNHPSKPNCALASRGGLASAPGFRKMSAVTGTDMLASRGGLSTVPSFKRAKSAPRKNHISSAPRKVSLLSSRIYKGGDLQIEETQEVPENMENIRDKVNKLSKENYDERILVESFETDTLIDAAQDNSSKENVQTSGPTQSDKKETASLAVTQPSSTLPSASSSSSLRLGLRLGPKQPRKRLLDHSLSRTLPEAVLTAKIASPSSTDNDDGNKIVASGKSMMQIEEVKKPEKDHPSLDEAIPEIPTKTRKHPANNDNFVRLNLRNSAGACRGARNKKRFRRNRFQRSTEERNTEWKGSEKSSSSGSQQYVSRMTGLDPLDEYLDGVFHKKEPTNAKAAGHQEDAPKCARHQRTCKLVVVKKNTTGNKGRKFYACSMPRGEQCNHFQWADDTVEAARRTLSKNTSHSSFIARQVAAHVDRFRLLTVPELRQEAARRNLNKQGKKQQLLMRLAIWARDEIASAVHGEEDAPESETSEAAKDHQQVEIDLLESDDSSDEESIEELEFFDGNSDKENSDDETSYPNESGVSETSRRDSTEEDKLLSSLQSIFGHSEFRDGQKWAVERCLDKKKSLLVAPTGFGKSLCYALPAALMDGVCVVVSPLISLIQVRIVCGYVQIASD